MSSKKESNWGIFAIILIISVSLKTCARQAARESDAAAEKKRQQQTEFMLNTQSQIIKKQQQENAYSITTLCDHVIDGTVEDDGNAVNTEFPYPNEELREKDLAYLGSIPKENFTVYKVNVKEILHGNLKNKVIKVWQYTTQNTKHEVTKLKKGDRKLFMLITPLKDISSFYTDVSKNSCIITDENDKVLSMSMVAIVENSDGSMSNIYNNLDTKAFENK